MCNSPTGYEAVYNGGPYHVLPVVSVDELGRAQVLNEKGELVQADSVEGFSHVRSAG